jgi:hypothetical protein
MSFVELAAIVAVIRIEIGNRPGNCRVRADTSSDGIIKQFPDKFKAALSRMTTKVLV